MQLLNDRQCSFAVQTVVCDGIIGDVSMAVRVNMIGPGMGSTGNKSSSLDSTRVQGLCVQVFMQYTCAEIKIPAGIDIEKASLILTLITNVGATVSSSIVIVLGAVIGAMFIVIAFITSIFTAITAVLIRSKQALRVEHELLKAKMKEQTTPVYEEITQLRIQDSLKSSSPPIDTGENTAYVSAFVMNACARTST